MFSRRPDRPREEPRPAGSAPTGRPGDLAPIPTDPAAAWGTPPAAGAPLPPGHGAPVAPGIPGVPGVPEPVAVAASRGDATVIAEHDHLEGTLRSAQGVLVLGSFSGSIESESWVRLAERSTVKADVTAQEVVVAGTYEGRLVASGRLEIAATGQVRGDIVAPRLQLHEGGFIDGALSMTQPDASRTSRSGTESAQSSGGSGTRGASSAPAAAAPATDEPSRPTSVRESGGGTSPRKGTATIPVAPDPAKDGAPSKDAAPEVPATR